MITARISVTGKRTAITIPENRDDELKITPIAPKKKPCQSMALNTNTK